MSALQISASYLNQKIDTDLLPKHPDTSAILDFQSHSDIMSAKRMTANPIRAPRHRPGKVVEEENSTDSESDEAQEEVVPAPSTTKSAPPKYASALGISSEMKKVDLSERRRIAAEAEKKRVEESRLKAEAEEGFVTASEEEEDDEDGEESGSGEDEESSEEESSEEEAPRRVMMRPTFVKKDKRKEGGIAARESEKAEAERLEREEEARLKAADEIVEEQIRKDLAAKAAGKKNWDDDEDEDDDVDDTDDVDVEAEIAAWKLRELRRIKRDREAIEEREKELEEIERRKNLTEDERKAEDDEYLAKQKDDKESKGKMGYMQKYYHKGAFFLDDQKKEGLDQRDLMGSRFADDVQNRELLPQALQLRDMTKVGKRGATKYKDLKSEDTGRWGQFDDRRPHRDGGGGFGADERFMPDRDRERDRSGANNFPLGERKPVAGAPDGPRAAREDGERKVKDSYRPRRRSRSPRSRSRSPRRKRSLSRDRFDSDKRRRIDS